MQARTRFRFPVLAVGLLALAWGWSGRVRAQTPDQLLSLAGRLQVDAAAEITRLDRQTGRLISEAAITLRNVSDRPIRRPLVVVVELEAPEGLSTIQVAQAFGGVGTPPWNWPWLDLSQAVGDRLEVGGETQFTLRLTRPNGVTPLYRLVPYGLFNRDPVVQLDGPSVGIVQETLRFTGTGSTDPDGDRLEYAWDFGDGATAAGVEAEHPFDRPGTYTVALTVTDPEGARSTGSLRVAITPAGVYALARTRVLAGDGQPLEVVATEETGPDEIVTLPATNTDGYLSLGGTPGAHVWRFSKPGHLTIWREATLEDQRLTFVPSPWMTLLSNEAVVLTPLFERRLSAEGGALVVRVEEGAATIEGPAWLTALGDQGLPSPLPLGWSPIAALHLELGTVGLAMPAELTVTPRRTARSGASRVLARFDAQARQWIAEVIVAADAPLMFPLAGGGTYALVLADEAPTAPPLATVGMPLSGYSGSVADVGGLTGEAIINPNPSVASPEPIEVTAAVEVRFMSPQAVPSGVFLRTDIEETYTLRDGRRVSGLAYDTSVFAYRDPAGALATELLARFPVRPSTALGPDQLAEALVRARIQRPDAFSAAIVGPSGGRASLDDLVIAVASGAFTRPGIIELREAEAGGVEILPADWTGIRAFELIVAGIAEGHALEPVFDGVAPNADFVLARQVRSRSRSGLEPVLRLRSAGNGRAASVEPATGPRLRGIAGAGRYVLVQLPGAVGLVVGTARRADTLEPAGLLARIQGQPWVTLTRAGGGFQLVAPPGAHVATVAHDDGEQTGATPFSLSDAHAVAEVEVIVGGAGLLVAEVEPAAGARAVPVISGVRVRFSRVLDQGTWSPNAVVLLDSDGGAVAGSLSLNLAGNEAVLLPASPLDFGADYRVVVDAGLRDRSGGLLSGANEFAFRTVAPPARPASGLVIYEPGATNIPVEVLGRLVGYEAGAEPSLVVAHGGPGTADPGVPVILVNLGTGATATVLSAADGSFASFLRAAEEDYLQAVFLNANGTRVTVDATRQHFDDGSVGLYGPGGLLAAETPEAAVEVTIPPGTLPARAVFKLVPLTVAQALAAVDGVQPEGGKIVAGFRAEVRGRLGQGDSSVSFPFDPSILEIPPGETPENGAFALCLVVPVEGGFAFQVVDKLRYENGRLISNTLPYAGWIGALTFGGPEVAAALIYGIHLNFGPHTITGETVLCEEEEPSEECMSAGRVLPGAIVRAFAQAAIRGPGGVPTGAVFASTGTEGRFALVVSGNPNQYSVAASHPRFGPGRILANNITVGALVSRWDFGFSELAQVEAPPSLTVTHRPVYPEPGEPVVVDARTTHPAGRVPGIELSIARVRSLIPGVPATPADVQVEVLGPGSSGPGFAQSAWRLSTTKAIQVTLSVTATGDANVRREHLIAFSGPPAPSPANPPAADPGDRQGPQVVASFPANGEFLVPGEAIVLYFNEPVDRAVLGQASLIRAYEGFHPNAAGRGGPVPGYPLLELSADQRRLELRFPQLVAARRYTLVVPSAAVRDLPGSSLDQDPVTEVEEPFTAFLTTAEQASAPLTETRLGGGALIKGSVLFTLERSGNGAIHAYDISNPARPQFVYSADLPGPPRSALLIPGYAFYVQTRNRLLVKRDLLVVAGGRVGPSWTGDQLSLGQAYLRVYDVTGPDIGPGPYEDPRFLNLMGGVVINQIDSIVAKLVWSAPNLYYLEHWTSVPPPNTSGPTLNGQQIAVVDLPEFIAGGNAPLDEQREFPLLREPGIDLNGDGDYADPGEVTPTPSRVPDAFFGKVAAYDLNDYAASPPFLTDQRILDFDVRGELLAVTVEHGLRRDPSGLPSGDTPIEAGYRSLALGGQYLPQAGALLPLAGSRPKRLFLLPAATYRLPTDLRPPGGPETQTLALAVVSLSPAANGQNALGLIDLTDPRVPQVLRLLPFPERFPDEDGLGSLQSVFPREDGRLELATTRHRVLLDPTRLLELPPTDPEALPPAFAGLYANTGHGHVMDGASPTGVRAVSALGDNRVFQDAPRLRFVSFPDQPAVVEPTSYAGDANALANLFRGLAEPGFLLPARVRSEGFVESTLTPPSPLVHYHLLLDAPGGSGQVVLLGLEVLDDRGQPLPPGGLGFPPFRSASAGTLQAIGLGSVACGLPTEPILAFRLSDDPASPWFDRYLSQPLAFVYERLQPDDWAALRQTDRLIFGSGAFVRGFIEPAMEPDPSLGPFAAQANTRRKRIIPVTSTTVQALPSLYSMGANPPPIGGHAEMPGTSGNVALHSGEFRHTTVDLELPSRRLPIVFQRTVGGQDLYQGPFGRGWDFNYHQRLTRLDPRFFPPGLKMPLVIRATEAGSAMAESGDVLFQNGEGRVVLFKDAGDSPPTGIAADPLVDRLGWLGRADRFYLPEPGVFEVLVRFSDGRYGRLTPGGTQFWYDATGRLARIVDRYEDNWHELIYTGDGRLRRIVDHTVPGEARYLELGYYLQSGDSLAEFLPGLDQRASNANWRGLVSTLRDFTGREVRFEYTPEGILQRRLGVAVAADCAEGFTGRSLTTYQTDGCGDVVGLVSGGSGPQAGAPIFAGAGQARTRGGLTMQSGNGLDGGVNLEVPTENSASGNENATRAATTADGARTRYTLDTHGRVKDIELTGPAGDPATWEMRHDGHGRLEFIRYPEGNSVEIHYDTANPVLRSRDNVVRMVRDPGPRGGGVITTRYAFDHWYNLPSGAQVDENGEVHTYSLASDHRTVERIQHGSDGETVRQHNGYGQLTFAGAADGGEQRFYHDATTGFLEREERGSMAVRYFYDGSIAARLGAATRVEFPMRAPIQRRYDPLLRLVEESRRDAFQRICYDENGRPVRIEKSVDVGRTVVQTRRYNQIGFLLEETFEDLETRGQSEHVTRSYTPDALSRVATIQHPGGQTETFGYDNHGQVIERHLGAYVEAFRRDRDGSLLEVRRGGDLVLERQYDGHRRVSVETRHLGDGGTIQESLTYFGRGELRTRRVEDSVFGLALAAETVLVDSLGRAREVRQAGSTIAPTVTSSFRVAQGLETVVSGPRETHRTFQDTAGLLRTRSDSLQTATFDYDANQRPELSTVIEDGVTYTSTQTFNDLDQPISSADDLGTRATVVPRLDGQLKEVTDARGHTTTNAFSRLGEPLGVRRPSGVAFGFELDRNRQPSFIGEGSGPPAGFRYTYDASIRRETETTRDGGVRRYQDFDGRNRPRTIVFPGGTSSATYDWQGRLTALDTTYAGGRNYALALRYDALDRVRECRFGAALDHRLEYRYDLAGPLLEITFRIAGETFASHATLYADGARHTLTYPSAATVEETRQPSGRLTRLQANGQPVVEVRAFSGADLRKETWLGQGLGDQPAVLRENEFDLRRRVIRTRYTQPATGRLLAELRYAYDATDNPVARQWIHRSGRTDFFAYDVDSRLSDAHHAARPAQPADEPRTLPGVIPAGNGFAPGAFGRIYGFDGLRDLLTRGTLVNPDGAPAYAFAQSQGGHDSFLFARTVDGTARPAPDPLGNASGTTLQVRPDAVGATGPAAVRSALFYDAFSRLARIEREDDVAIDYEYAPDGLMVRKRVTAVGGTQLVSDRLFVWREQRLLEEWEMAPVGRTLAARYYYADGDSPMAADLLDHGQLVRVFYLTDAQGSVIGLTDADGNMVERVSYDPYGQPRIERLDVTPPVVALVLQHAAGLLIVFTEAVLPRLLPDSGQGLAVQTDPLGTIIQVVGFSGQTVLAESASGFPYGHAVFFRGNIPSGSAVTINIAGHALEDEWGNPVAPATISFTASGPPGTVLFSSGVAIGSTAAGTTSRSVLGNPMLFHGQRFDYDAGLLYLRARFYDPFTGTFLQRDPSGYSDSVNPYCAFANNPLKFRDPSGRFVIVLAPLAILKGAFAGALIGFATDAVLQMAGWTWDWLVNNRVAEAAKGLNARRSGGAIVTGALGGAFGAITERAVGVSLLVSRALAGLEGGVSGVAERAITGEEGSGWDVARDVGVSIIASETGRHFAKRMQKRGIELVLGAPRPRPSAATSAAAEALEDAGTEATAILRRDHLELAHRLHPIHREINAIQDAADARAFFQRHGIVESTRPDAHLMLPLEAGVASDPMRNFNSLTHVEFNPELLARAERGEAIQRALGPLDAISVIKVELFHSVNARALFNLRGGRNRLLPSQPLISETEEFDAFARSFLNRNGVDFFERIRPHFEWERGGF